MNFLSDFLNQFLGRTKRNDEVYLSLEGILGILVYAALGWVLGGMIASLIAGVKDPETGAKYKFATLAPAPIAAIKQLVSGNEFLFTDVEVAEASVIQEATHDN